MRRRRLGREGHPFGAGLLVAVLLVCGLTMFSPRATSAGIGFGILCLAGALLVAFVEVFTAIKSRAAARRLAERKERR